VENLKVGVPVITNDQKYK